MTRTIAVILPVNNPDILKQVDLQPYQSEDCFFELHYVDTHLRELNTAEEGALVSQLTSDKAKDVARSGASAVIIYAFGEFGFEERLQQLLSIPVLTLGAQSIREASRVSQKKFTILPGMIAHNGFLEGFVSGMNLVKNNYQPAKKSPEVSPAQIRGDAAILQKLYQLACEEIEKNGVDAFTLGCGSFIGIGRPLQDALQRKFGQSIHVVDPVEITFNFVKRQLIHSRIN